MDNKIRIRRAHILLGLLAAAAVLAGCGSQAPVKPAGGPGLGEPGGPVPVTVASAEIGSMRQTVPVTGDLAALEDVTVSAKAVGRVVMVAAREGDVVRKGEVLVQQFNSDLDANVQLAQAGVDSAVAKLRQAYVNYQIGVVNADQGVLQAKASLAQFQQTFLKERNGSRPQEILEAQDTVDSARANMDNAKITLDRDTALYGQGAIAKADLDTAQTTYNVDAAQFNNAQQALDLAKIGNRVEDISGAAAGVRQQETALRNALINRREIALRKDDIIAAQAALDQARATLAYNQEQASYARITSPIDGIVATRSTEPGQEATAGTALLRVVNLSTVYYEPTVSETQISGIHVGQYVAVTTDALPGRVFAGRVAAIYPEAMSGERTFNIRVTVPNPQSLLRPGMFARGSVVTMVHRNVVIVPATALVPDASGEGFQPNTSSDELVSSSGLVPSEHVVVVGDDGRAAIRHVKVGIADMDHAEIISGLRPGEMIVVVGQDGLHAGDKLAIVSGGKPHSPTASGLATGAMEDVGQAMTETRRTLCG
ncbi:MAG: efflux RND transporter periplasmic adaptor subunit [Capsulimonadaceae bacterium]